MAGKQWLVWTLEQLLGWSDDDVRSEFRWLRMMARFKYDGYQDYVAGMRFLPSLVAWLQQFQTTEERRAAYQFVKGRLVYISPSELQRLVELFFPDKVHHSLLRDVTAHTHVPAYQILVSNTANECYHRFLRQTLFLGLSDGARLDLFRRSNVGAITNEQVVIATQLDKNKWRELVADLTEDLQDSQVRFRAVYLIDDFTGSGTSLVRLKNGKWRGKLVRFLESIADLQESPFEPDWKLRVHHYIAGPGALSAARERDAAASEAMDRRRVEEFSAGLELPDDIRVTETSDPSFYALTQEYYNKKFATRHTLEGGTDNVKLGFGGCALPLVLEHNTPNNSVLLLWGDTEAEGYEGKRIRPLFRRRQRHT